MTAPGEATDLEKVHNAFLYVCALLRLRGRRLERLRVNASPFRRWLQIHYYRPTKKR